MYQPVKIQKEIIICGCNMYGPKHVAKLNNAYTMYLSSKKKFPVGAMNSSSPCKVHVCANSLGGRLRPCKN